MVRDFDKKAYSENDAKAKAIWIKHLQKKGFAILDAEENLGIDILAFSNGTEYRFEVEMNCRKSLTTGNYISFLQRKARMKNFYYVIIHENTKQYVATHSTNIFKAEYLVTKEVISRGGGIDIFYHVPLEVLKVNKL